jgi:hypothetical protein
MVWTLTPDQTEAYYLGSWDEIRVIDDVIEDLDKAGVHEVVAVLPADESCVLFWVDERTVI